MMISTKGRYALRILADIEIHSKGNFVPLKDCAERQDISLKYLERIAFTLTQSGILESSHGKGGGYRLGRPAEEITVYQVLDLMEGGVAPVACLECGAIPCERAAICPTLTMWRRFHEMTKEYFSGITIRDLSETKPQLDFVI